MNNNLPIRFGSTPFGGSAFTNLFDSLFQGDLFSTRMPGFSAALDRTVDEDGTLVYRFDLPGVSREDITIEAHGKDHLLVSGERKSETRKPDWSERTWGRFQRLIPVPHNWAREDLKATLQEGVLTISIPARDKEELEEEPQRFAIE